MPQRRSKSSGPGGELGETLGMVTKRYGDNTVQMAKDVHQPDRISTGVFIMDFATLGGFPENRISMVVGERHSGKSTIANKLIGSAQARYPDQTPVVLDVEGTFESTWAEQLGVNIDDLVIVKPESGEMAVDVGDAILGSEETSLLVVDSIAALVPMKEIEDSAEDAHVGLQARLVGNFIRRMTASLIRERRREHYVTVLFLNQFRSKIGVSFGDPRTLPGGKILEFSTSIQCIMRNKEHKGKDDVSNEIITHNEHAFTLTKNKLNNGPRTGDFVLQRMTDEDNSLEIGDVDDAATVLSYAKKFGLYTGGGSSWTLEFEGHSSRYSKAAEAIRNLREDPDLYWDLRTYIIRMQAVRLGMKTEFIERIV